MSFTLRTILTLICGVSNVRSAVPHPSDFGNEHSIRSHQHHREQSLTLSQLKLISPAFCETLSDDECRRRDAQLVNHTARARKLIQTTGAVKPLVICLRFQDHSDRKLPSRYDIDFLFNAGPGVTDKDLLPTGSVAEYLRQNSYGRLHVDAEVIDWIETDNTEEFYAAKVSGRTPYFANAFHPVLDSLEDDGFDFSEYDQDGDGVIDVLIVMHSGYPAEDLIDDCDGQSYVDRIWAHAANAYDAEAWVSSDGNYQLGAYVVASSLRQTSHSTHGGDGGHRRCDDNMARIGVVTHEFIHTWGIPDLYETIQWGHVGYGSGYYDIMSQPNGVDGTQNFPSNTSPWTKIRLGWLTPTEITHDGEYEIEASALAPNVFAIKSKFPGDEYLLIENRQPIGYDSLLWSGGLLIWKIDDSVEDNNDAGYPGMSGWPGTGMHYRVAVLQADRKYDLEQRVNEGDSGDFWTSGKELLPGRTEFEATNYEDYPNTNSYNGAATGIRIYDISESKAKMSFKVAGLAPAPPTTASPISFTFDLSSFPTNSPSTETPTFFPTWNPTSLPTFFPSKSPEEFPTAVPTSFYTPTESPSAFPTLDPSSAPSSLPSNLDSKLYAQRATEHEAKFVAELDAESSTKFGTKLYAQRATKSDAEFVAELDAELFTEFGTKLYAQRATESDAKFVTELDAE